MNTNKLKKRKTKQKRQKFERKTKKKLGPPTRYLTCRVRTILVKAVPSSSPRPAPLRPSWESLCSMRTISEQMSSSCGLVRTDGCGDSPPFSRSSSAHAPCLSVSLSRDRLEDAIKWWSRVGCCGSCRPAAAAAGALYGPCLWSVVLPPLRPRPCESG